MPRSVVLSVVLLVATLPALAACSFQGGVDVEPAAGAVTTSAVTTSTDPAPTASRPAASPPASPTASPVTSPSSVPSSAPSPSTPPAALTACSSTQLVAALTTSGPSAATGTVTLTNTSRTPCTLKGFGGIALARSDGSPVLSRQQRTDATATSLVLSPGAAAASTISWSRTAVASVGEPATGDCEPVPTSLLVIPPNQIDHLAVPWPAGPVCNQGTITQTPYTDS